VDKLGEYISDLMMVIRNTEEVTISRTLALDELKRLSSDISSFIFEHIDDIETLPEFEEDTSERAKKLYMEHWTCELCGKHTHEVDYDYLSGTDHLECVLEKEQPELVENNERMDIIGQNGNDGLHYSENENQMELEL
tara:strand:+ start:227 stop:640 length:414 start_codon:yes stop_codon:yes gene_type:complete